MAHDINIEVLEGMIDDIMDDEILLPVPPYIFYYDGNFIK